MEALTPFDRAGRRATESHASSRQLAGRTATITQDTSANPGDLFYLDLHTHSTDGSDDAGATVEGYLRWITGRRRFGYRIDGFVLTEHRRFDADRDYTALAEQYGVTVLRGIEVETDVGHVLVYGVAPGFYRDFDVTNVSLPYEDVFRAAREHGGIAVGAHAGRPRIGLAEHVDRRSVSVEGVGIVEALNGGSSDEENSHALHFAEEHGLKAVGGSDSHFVSGIARCLTAFPEPVHSVEALVEALLSHEYRPVAVEETHDDEEIRERSRRLQAVRSTAEAVHHEGGEVEYDHSVIGVEVEIGSAEITHEQIAAYCESTGDTNPLYRDEAAAEAGPFGGLVAPPGLLSALVQGRGPDPKVQYGNTTFMSGQRMEYVAPVRPGDTITGYASVKEVYEKTGRSGRMVFVVNRTRYANQRGEDVSANESSMVHRQVAPRKES
ncbi:MAG: MaoC family dehydratase N-terminal domain-containing protein [Chloroflexi bacterium]|nr:MaoC family dehydratase N-terminal domain-containing protein [Chloroflexota bacterium]MDA1004117.1 MaoC family dehydratase N-terminal domain-containing protein [Chloroflexota bacterium]